MLHMVPRTSRRTVDVCTLSCSGYLLQVATSRWLSAVGRAQRAKPSELVESTIPAPSAVGATVPTKESKSRRCSAPLRVS